MVGVSRGNCDIRGKSIERGERERDFKELAHIIEETGKSSIRRIGWQAGDPGKSPKSLCWGLGQQSDFGSHSTDWMRPTYTMEGKLFYSVY